MAKKNLHGLMSGILGESNTPSNSPVDSTVETPHSSENASPNTQSGATVKRGRPRKDNDDTRTTLVISAELLRKVKYVSLMEDTTLKDIVDEALSLYVSKWEHDNGPIRLPKK